MEPEDTQNKAEKKPERHQGGVDNRPLTSGEQARWWVMSAMSLFSLLLLSVLMALSHSPLTAN